MFYKLTELDLDQVKESRMSELNSDWVLWMSIGTVVVSLVVLFAYGRKLFRAMDGIEEDK